jgi:hypothetical protein
MGEVLRTLEVAVEDFLRRIIREEIQAFLSMHGGAISATAGIAKTYLIVKEALDLSRLAASMIRLVIRKRKLRTLQVGRRVLIKRTDLRAF